MNSLDEHERRVREIEQRYQVEIGEAHRETDGDLRCGKVDGAIGRWLLAMRQEGARFEKDKRGEV